MDSADLALVMIVASGAIHAVVNAILKSGGATGVNVADHFGVTRARTLGPGLDD